MASSDFTTFDTFNVVSSILFAIATITTVTRLYTRASVLRSFGLDDFLIIAATVLELVLFPLQFDLNLRLERSVGAPGATPAGGPPPGLMGEMPMGGPSLEGAAFDGIPSGALLGTSGGRLPTEAIKEYGNSKKLDYITVIFYLVCIALIKFSILAFYRRFLPKTYVRAIYVVGVITGLYTIATCLASIFQCTPIDAAWKPTSDLRCPVDRLKLHISIGFANLASDTVILLMPVPSLLKLQISIRKKCILLLIFSLGVVGTIATGMRLNTVYKLHRVFQQFPPDFRRLMSIIGESSMWMQVEVSSATVCANFPALAALWKALRARGRPKHSYNYASATGYSLSGLRTKDGGGTSTNKSVTMTARANSPSSSERALTGKHGESIVRSTKVDVRIETV